MDQPLTAGCSQIIQITQQVEIASGKAIPDWSLVVGELPSLEVSQYVSLKLKMKHHVTTFDLSLLTTNHNWPHNYYTTKGSQNKKVSQKYTEKRSLS